MRAKMLTMGAIAAFLVCQSSFAWWAPYFWRLAPASRVENIASPAGELPDQEFQNVTFETPLLTSLVTVANLGGSGHRSFLVTVSVYGGGSFSFQVKEGHEDVTLPLSQQIPVTGVSIRCDSFSEVHCRYSVSLVGD